MTNPLLQALNLNKAFDQEQAAKDASLAIDPRDFLTIIGRKTTTKSD